MPDTPSTAQSLALAQDTRVPLSIEERRQIVYSSLLRFAPETASLRERALDKAILGSLIGSTEEVPFRVGTISQNLKIGPAAIELRTETIQESLDRLSRQDLVGKTELNKRHAYYLTKEGENKARLVINRAEELFVEVLDTLLKDTEGIVSRELAANIFLRFTFECFARFGQLIAKNVTGQITNQDLIRRVDLDLTFGHVVADKGLSPAAKETLKSRCLAFLRSSNEADQKLKFYLTQGYYFTKLLGLETGRFDPLNEEAFSNSVFYLDTNILLAGIIRKNENQPLFAETVRLAKRLGIKLMVTRATIDEARRVAAEHLQEIGTIIETIPEDIIEKRSKDEFLHSFLAAQEDDADLTPEEFLEPFNDLPKFLAETWEIEMDDLTSEEIINGQNITRVSEVINESAVKLRGWGKSEKVLEHDVAYYLLISEERKTNTKTWFLTRDRTLVKAAEDLSNGERSFCFSLIGFLHSVSPFLATATEERPFVETFSSFITEQVFPIHNVFDAKELALMAEYHEDVMKTPVDQLTMAFDYVKTKTLQGRPYTRNDIPAVSLELKKFLSSSRDEQITALEQETERLAVEREAELQKRIEAEQITKGKELTIAALEAEIESLQNSDASNKQDLAEIRRELENDRAAQAKRRSARRLRNMLAGFVAGILIWTLDEKILSYIIRENSSLAGYEIQIKHVLTIIGGLLFAPFAFVWITRKTWVNEAKVVSYAVIIILGLFLSQAFSNETLSTLSDYFGVGGFIATLVLVAFLTRAGKP